MPLDCCKTFALSSVLYRNTVSLLYNICFVECLYCCTIVAPLVVLGGHFTRDGARDRRERTHTYV